MVTATAPLVMGPLHSAAQGTEKHLGGLCCPQGCGILAGGTMSCGSHRAAVWWVGSGPCFCICAFTNACGILAPGTWGEPGAAGMDSAATTRWGDCAAVTHPRAAAAPSEGLRPLRFSPLAEPPLASGGHRINV